MTLKDLWLSFVLAEICQWRRLKPFRTVVSRPGGNNDATAHLDDQHQSVILNHFVSKSQQRGDTFLFVGTFAGTSNNLISPP